MSDFAVVSELEWHLKFRGIFLWDVVVGYCLRSNNTTLTGLHITFAVLARYVFSE
jgi:hypothetical protein